MRPRATITHLVPDEAFCTELHKVVCSLRLEIAFRGCRYDLDIQLTCNLQVFFPKVNTFCSLNIRRKELFKYDMQSKITKK